MGREEIAEALEPAQTTTKEQTRKQVRKHARRNWKKVQKFKNTLGRVMALQTQTHMNKSDGQDSNRTKAIFSYKTLFESGPKFDDIRPKRINLKQSNILQLHKPVRKRTLAPLKDTPRVKAI